MLSLHSYDSDRDKFLGVEDLKKMIKKIKASPIEPSGVEDMIKEVDEDGDGKLSLREVLVMLIPHSLYTHWIPSQPVVSPLQLESAKIYPLPGVQLCIP